MKQIAAVRVFFMVLSESRSYFYWKASRYHIKKCLSLLVGKSLRGGRRPQRIEPSRQSTSTNNQYVESFNGKFRDECLSMIWFMDLDDGREKIKEFRIDFNTVRPHSSIFDLLPEEFTYFHQTNPEFFS
jgi:transposase InsO family protein